MAQDGKKERMDEENRERREGMETKLQSRLGSQRDGRTLKIISLIVSAKQADRMTSPKFASMIIILLSLCLLQHDCVYIHYALVNINSSSVIFILHPFVHLFNEQVKSVFLLFTTSMRYEWTEPRGYPALEESPTGTSQE